MTMHEEKLRLEHEAELLSKQLAAAMKDKHEPRSTEFDAETPIDKVLNVMQSYIEKVEPCTLCFVSAYQIDKSGLQSPARTKPFQARQALVALL